MVVSCRFLRLNCNEDDHPLFRREYARCCSLAYLIKHHIRRMLTHLMCPISRRNNRERGVKLLRCFPHCCPEHARRSYCGCSVNIMVAFSEVAPPDEIVVCARFEPSWVAPLWPAGLAGLAGTTGERGDNQETKCRLDVGESVFLPESLFGSAGRAASEGGEWILAEKESYTNQRAAPKNCVLYVLNNRLSPKWFYSYDSSVTRTQREMTHHLVAYVFRVLPGSILATQQMHTQTQQQTVERPNVVVLARHASPAFHLVSYRRSGGAAGKPGCALPAMETPIAHKEMASWEILTASSIVHERQQQWIQQQRLQQRVREEGGSRPQPKLDVPLAPTVAGALFDTEEKGIDRTADLTRPGDTTEGTSLWQHEAEAREQGFRGKIQQLLILWHFLQHISWSDLGLSTGDIAMYLRPHWLQAATALRTPPVVLDDRLEGVLASLLSRLFGSSVAQMPDTREQDTATIRTCAHLFLRGSASRAVQHRFRSGFCGGVGQCELRARFTSLVVDLYDALNTLLGEVAQGLDEEDSSTARRFDHENALEVLVDDVLSLVYRQTRFEMLRTVVSAFLLDRQTSNSLSSAVESAFRAFATQAQETAAGLVLLQRQSQQNSSGRGGLELPSAWNRRWLLDPGSVQVVDVASGANCLNGLVDICQFVGELGCLDIKLRQQHATLILRTALTLHATESMELVLDGQLRRFRALPSGISSKIATTTEWTIGDYSSAISEDGGTVDIHFFAFRVNYTTGAQGLEADDVATVRRTSVSLMIGQDLDSNEPATRSAHPRDHFVIVHGTVCSSTLRASTISAGAFRLTLADMSSADRGALWSEIDWTRDIEFQAGYVAL